LNKNNVAGYFKTEDFEPLIQQAKANPCRCKAHSQDEQNKEVTLLDVLPPAL
tara:strand:- start:1968 stop:2123 length:156 start_codon:yes stop_codon:yes gene_type:complete